MSPAPAIPSAEGLAVPRGPVWVAQLFLLSLLIPFYLPLGSLLLMPHRIIIIIAFFPFFLRLYVLRRAGPILIIDWLILGSALWAAVSFFVNHEVNVAIEASGIHMVEFFGGYLVARVAIRSGHDFRRFVRTFLVLTLVLVPFAIMESVLHRPLMLELLPGNSVGVSAANPRFGLRRAQTVFAHSILFGAFISTGLGLFWYALRPRWLQWPGAALAVIGTVVSLSSGALISLVMQSIFIGWEMILKFIRRRWSIFAGLSVLAYILIDLLSNRTPFHVLVTYATFNTGSAYNRIRIWNYGTDNVWANPIFGLGMNDWVRPSYMSSSVDNFWLLLAMRHGLPAIIMLMVALFLIVRRVSLADLPDRQDQLARAGFLTAFGGLVLAGGTVHYWHALMAFAMFLIGSGAWMISGGGQTESEPQAKEPDSEPRLSRYTRQRQGGNPIGRAAGQGATASNARAKTNRASLPTSPSRAATAKLRPATQSARTRR